MADIVKIYEIKMQGQKQVLDDSKKILTSFEDLKKKFIDLKATLMKDGLSAGDLAKYNAELKSTNIEYQNLQKQIEKTGNTKRAFENSSSSRQTNAGQISANNIGSGVTNNLNANLKQVEGNVAQFTQSYVRFQNEQTAATKRLQSAQTSLAVEESKTGKEIAVVKMQTANARKQNRAAAEAELVIQSRINQLSESEKQRLANTVSLYSKVEMKMRTLQNEYKGLATAKQLGIKLSDEEIKRMDFLSGKIEKYDSTLKAVDASMGRHQRNVGNYASGFNSLNMSVAQITREMPAFANSAQTGFMAISNNLPIFFDAIAQASKVNKELQAQGQPTTSVLKQVAGALFSFQTLLSVGIVLLTVYGKDIVNWTRNIINGSKAVDIMAKVTEDLNSAMTESHEKASKQIADTQMLYAVMKNETLARKDRLQAAKELQDLYPKIFGNMSTEQMMLGNTTKKYEELKKAILASAMAEAIKNKIAKATQEFLDKEQENLDAVGKAKINAAEKQKLRGQKITNVIATQMGAVVDSHSGDEEANSAEYVLQMRRNQRKKDADDYNAYVEKMLKIGQKYQVEGEKIEKTDKIKKPKEYSGSKLTGVQKDHLKDLEAERNRELAILEKKYIDGKIFEETYIREGLKINKNYFDKKIAYLKSGNAEERKLESQAILEKAKMEHEANDKLYALFKKRYEDQLKLAEKSAKDKLENVINDPYSTEQQKLDAEKVYHDESVNAQMIYNLNMIKLESDLTKTMVDDLNQRNEILQQKEKQRALNSIENEIKRRDLLLKQVDKTYEEITNANEIKASSDKVSILNNKKLTQEKQKIELQKVSANLELSNANAMLGKISAKLALIDIDIMSGKQLTEQEWERWNLLRKQKSELEEQKALADQKARIANATIDTPLPGQGVSGLASSISKSLQNSDNQILIGGKDQSQLIGEVIAQSFDLANQAMNTYFDAERQRVEQSKQLAYERIDLEKQQMMRFAQSQAERDSLEKQAAEKKKQADKEAGEKLKKIKKQELKIALATELANIGVAAAIASAAYGPAAPIMLPILYGMMALLAIGRYAINSKAVDSAQYGRGGKMKRWFGLGGRIDNGTYHSENNGMPIINPKTNEVEAYIEKEEGIINKNSMRDKNIYSVSGTPSQIASKINSIGGGVDWDGGATIKKFMKGGPYLGSNLQPPVFRSYYESSGSRNTSESSDLTELKQMITELAKLQQQESSKRVYVSQREISNAQSEYNKQTEIATL